MPGFGDYMMPPPSLEDLLIWEATHCAHCHRERVTVAEISGVWVCRECALAADVAASRAIDAKRSDAS
jgi:ribosomal protein L37AE/L43A